MGASCETISLCNLCISLCLCGEIARKNSHHQRSQREPQRESAKAALTGTGSVYESDTGVPPVNRCAGCACHNKPLAGLIDRFRFFFCGSNQLLLGNKQNPFVV